MIRDQNWPGVSAFSASRKTCASSKITTRVRNHDSTNSQ